MRKSVDSTSITPPCVIVRAVARKDAAVKATRVSKAACVVPHIPWLLAVV